MSALEAFTGDANGDTLGFEVMVWPSSGLWVDFVIYEVIATSLPGGERNYREAGKGLCDFTEDKAKAAPWATGFVKWDGCAEFHISDTASKWPHFCDPAEVAEVAQAMQLAYSLAHGVLDVPDFEVTS